MKQNKLTFLHNTCESEVTLDVQELCYQMAQLREHIVTVREICARTELGRRSMQSIVKYDQRQTIVSKCDIHTTKRF